MEDVARYGERIVVMEKGRVFLDGDVKNVFAHSKELEEIGLAAPQVTYLMKMLADNGMNVDTTVTTVEEAKTTILSAMKE